MFKKTQKKENKDVGASEVDKNTPILLGDVPPFWQSGALSAAFIALHISIIICHLLIGWIVIIMSAWMWNFRSI